MRQQHKLFSHEKYFYCPLLDSTSKLNEYLYIQDLCHCCMNERSECWRRSSLDICITDSTGHWQIIKLQTETGGLWEGAINHTNFILCHNWVSLGVFTLAFIITKALVHREIQKDDLSCPCVCKKVCENVCPRHFGKNVHFRGKMSDLSAKNPLLSMDEKPKHGVNKSKS